MRNLSESDKAMQKVVADLMQKKEKLRTDLVNTQNVISGLQATCQHVWGPENGTPNYTWRKCEICRFLDKY